MDHRLISLIKRCVDCRQMSLSYDRSQFLCQNCGRTYCLDKDGILQAMPRQESNSTLAFYNTPFYKKWQTIWEEMIDDWVIYKNSLYRYFSMSGHRKITKYLSSLNQTDDIIVELGCGGGQLYKVYSHQPVFGVDHNLHFLRLLKKQYPQVTCIQADMINTPFADGSVNYTVSIHTLEHLYYIAEAMEEIVRILKPEGRLLFSIPTEGGIGWALGRYFITKPALKNKYQIDAIKVMEIEHINDAKRVLRFINFYLNLEKKSFSPFNFLPLLGINHAINGIAKKDDKN